MAQPDYQRARAKAIAFEEQGERMEALAQWGRMTNVFPDEREPRLRYCRQMFEVGWLSEGYKMLRSLYGQGATLEELGDLPERFLKSAPANSLISSLHEAKHLGMQPSFIVDIGAFRGEFTLAAKEIFPKAEVLMIEANPRSMPGLEAVCARYQDSSVACCQSVLGAEDGREVTFYLDSNSEGDSGASIYQELRNPRSGSITLEMRTLQTVLRHFRLPNPQIIKIDVQGAELDVLRGAGSILDDVQVLCLEASIAPYNDGAPLLAEILNVTDSLGFQCVDLVPMTRVGTARFTQQVDLFLMNKRCIQSEIKRA